jgi:hypothetical protein
MCSLPKDYPQLRREPDAKSTKPTHSAHPLWSSQTVARLSARAFPCPSKCPRDEMCSSLKQYPQLRRDAKSTPPSHSAHHP